MVRKRKVVVLDDLGRLLFCIATMKRGWTEEQHSFINELERKLFPEGDDDEI